MFEITLCLSLYTLVLAIEFSPALFERLGWRRLVSIIHKLALPLVMLGVILSTLHQSSFGSLFLIVPGKLHPLWYTPLLPILFLVSAVCAGITVVIAESLLCAKFLNQRLSSDLLVELARVCSVVLWGYLALKAADVWWRGAWRLIPTNPWLGWSFLLEVVGGILIPAIWLGRISQNDPPRAHFLASGLVIAGVVLNRMNISWFGLLGASGVLYVPSWMELVVTAAFVLIGIMAFLAVSRFIPVFAQDPTTI
jgi:Ni/Fe-hydrogenase subunit HybB-like protein